MSNKKEYKIVFEKWYSPYAHDQDEKDLIEKFDLSKIDPDEDNFWKQQQEEEMEDGKPSISLHHIDAAVTQLGIVPLEEYTKPDKIFNFWVGHTNFNISKAVHDVIERVEGVEILRVFTRYRFRVAIGKVYNHAVVCTNIQKEVEKFLKSSSPVKKKLLDKMNG